MKRNLNLEILINEVNQGDFLSIDIFSKKKYLKDTFILLKQQILEESKAKESILAKIPVNFAKVYDIPIPFSFAISNDGEIEYFIELIQNNQTVCTEKFYVKAAHIIYDFIFNIERFYNFTEEFVYTDLNDENHPTWVEFSYQGTSGQLDLMMAFVYKKNLEIMVCIAKGGSENNSWKKEYLEIKDDMVSALTLKRFIDDAFSKHAPDFNIYYEESDNDEEEVFALLDEADENMIVGNYDDAFKLLKLAESIKDLPDIHFELGRCMVEADYSYENAISEFKKAVQMEEDNYQLLEGYLVIIENALLKGEVEEAVSYSEEAIEESDKNANDFLDIGILYKKYGYYEEALKYIDKALKKEHNNWFFSVELGDCYKEIGNYEEAEHFYEKAYKIYPDNPILSAVTSLAIIKFKKGEVKEARKIAENILNIQTDFSQCGYSISNLEFTIIFDKKLWQKYIEKFPEMKDVKEGNNPLFNDPLMPFDDFIV